MLPNLTIYTKNQARLSVHPSLRRGNVITSLGLGMECRESLQRVLMKHDLSSNTQPYQQESVTHLSRAQICMGSVGSAVRETVQSL
jgi:hypothetical protein